MQIGFIGLGKMGINMVQRLLEGGHEAVVYNRTPAKVKKAEELGAAASDSIEGLINKLQSPRIVWLMIPAGQATDDIIKETASFLKEGDILIDGGNSFYKDSIKRAEMLKEQGIYFLDIGTSGGIWGLKRGYCMMVGGKREIFERVEPILKTLAPKDGYAHVGPSGAGHFVKMIHNGIEYAMLQSYAEGFEILKARKDFDLDLKQISDLWNHGSVIE